MASPPSCMYLDIPGLTVRLALAGIALRSSDITEIGRGADNAVFVAYRDDDVPVVIKVRTTTRRARYATAAWASHQLQAVRVAAPEHIWHDDDIYVESRVIGTPVDIAADESTRELAAIESGRVLRAVHSLPVVGFGRLDPTGRAPHVTLAAWLTGQQRPPPPVPPGSRASLGTRAATALRELAPSLRPRPPCLLHGDWVARHVLTRGGRVVGVIDLESVRGGDPMADLAGWSLQEPADLTEALFVGYRLDRLNEDTCLRLVLHRIRIGLALTRYHLATGGRNRARLHAGQIEADLNDLDAGHLRPAPRIAPPRSQQHPTT
ncbi:MAG: phosphotransferase family protein [Pseudonocardiaceae bacterium]